MKSWAALREKALKDATSVRYQIPPDMDWKVRSGVGVCLHFRWKDEDFWFGVRSYQLDQDFINEIADALRSNAYRAKGLPLPPYPLSADDPLRVNISRSQFYIKWEWNRTWTLSLWALDHVNDRDCFFQECHQPPNEWVQSDFDYAMQSLYATADHARMGGWA